MRYLHKRNEFLVQKNILSKNINFSEEIKTSALVNETFENDITWGGSMIGRLINSAIRRFKIGYSQTQVGPLLKKLEDELNYLISSSLQGDTLKKYNEFRVRGYFEEIRDICLSNRTEQEKLNNLLGQSTGLYDPNDPKKNQRTIGIVQEALDVITDDLKDLKKIYGEDRDRLLDKLSDFNDDLRKLTVAAGTPVQDTQQGNVNNFSLNFLNTLNTLKKNNLITASYNFDSGLVNSFQLFTELRLLETETAQVNTQVDKKTVGETKTPPTQTTPQPVGIPEKEYKDAVVVLNKKNDEISKNDETIKKLLNDIETKLTDDQKKKIKVKYDGKDISLFDAIQKFKSEIVKESRYVILEATGGGGSFGTQSGTPSTPKKNTVESIWNLYEFDKDRSVTRLTQREVDEMEALLSKGTQNLRYEPEKRPDPIVSIARIFGEAHQLYFCDVIPSGRPNGRISQKTFREYYKLGKQPGKWTQGESPEGPFAVKSIFNKWKTGVEKLLMNQEYRKILSNIKFVVPGAEDKFNDSFDTKVFEAEVPQVKTQSQGQVLFEFMNNMLDKTKLDDFDALRSTLMSKYFGITMLDKDKKPETPQANREPSRDDFEPNVAYFTSLQDPKIDVTKSKFYAIPIKKFADGQGKTYDTIFLQAIKKITVDKNNDALLVKFTYQSPIIMKKYHEKQLSNKKYVDWSAAQTPPNKVYYGLIPSKSLNIGNGKKFTIVYGNVNKAQVEQIYNRPFTVEEGARETTSGKITIKPSKFVYNDDQKVQDIILPQGFQAKLMTNDEVNHDDNLKKTVKSTNKPLEESLKEEVKKIL